MTKRPMYLQHVNVYVRNVERSKKWYEELLGPHVYEYRSDAGEVVRRSDSSRSRPRNRPLMRSLT